MTKIDLITGILGAGKTTFLRKYAKYLMEQGNRIAILVNDFGAVNVDMMLLQDLKGERCQLEMVSGGCDPHCHRRRFKTQLIALGMQHFDRVLLEPSGIFDMDEFFDTLYESPLDRWFEIGSVLTVVDATTEERLPEQMEYLFASEAACCGRLLLSKRSLVPEETDAQVSERLLAHLNRSLEGIRCDRRFTERDLFMKDWDALTEADLASLASAGYRGSSYVKQFHPEAIESETRYFMHIRIPEAHIRSVIGAVMQDPDCGSIQRIKGSLPADDGGWLKVNAVGGEIELAPVDEAQAVLIVIGSGIRREKIDGYLKPVNTDPAYVSI